MIGLNPSALNATPLQHRKNGGGNHLIFGSAVMPTTCRHVLQRFPREAALIARLVDESEDFCSLCEDYELIVETLGRLLANPKSDKELIKEYRSFLLELE